MTILINIIVLFHMLDFRDRIRDITAPVGLFAVGSPVCRLRSRSVSLSDSLMDAKLEAGTWVLGY